MSLNPISININTANLTYQERLMRIFSSILKKINVLDFWQTHMPKSISAETPYSEKFFKSKNHNVIKT